MPESSHLKLDQLTKSAFNDSKGKSSLIEIDIKKRNGAEIKDLEEADIDNLKKAVDDKILELARRDELKEKAAELEEEVEKKVNLLSTEFQKEGTTFSQIKLNFESLKYYLKMFPNNQKIIEVHDKYDTMIREKEKDEGNGENPSINLNEETEMSQLVKNMAENSGFVF